LAITLVITVLNEYDPGAGSVCRQWVESLQGSTVRRVTFIFVPGHAGAGGNKRADRLASLATIADGRPIDRADIVNALREICRWLEFKDSRFTSLVRMRTGTISNIYNTNTISYNCIVCLSIITEYDHIAITL
jgi:hypothetical protein